MTATAPTEEKKFNRQTWPALLHRMARTVRSRDLFQPGEHFLVAVSGGPDSVALLSLLHRLRASWRLSLTAAHFNYGLRGEESDGDQEFVTALCRYLEVPLVTRRLDVRRRTRGSSLQAAARDLRYRALAEIAEQCGADRIAVGHTADDQAETMLLWMLRGAGLTGLAGMPAARDGKIIRPLYDSTRKEVLAYLGRSGLSYRQDSSNEKLLYARNRIRHELLPLLKRLVPSSVQALCRSADLCREDDRYLDAHLASLCEGHVRQAPDGSWVTERAFVRQLPRSLQRRLIRDLLRRCDPVQRAAGARMVEQIVHAVMRKGTLQRTMKSGRLLVTELEVRCVPSRREVLQDKNTVPTPMVLVAPSQVVWAGTGQTIQVQQQARKQVDDVKPGPARIVVDAERVSAPLIVRPWQPGDRFQPQGMHGRSKKLQDFFTDLKIPIAARRRIPVVAAPEGIVWIVGYRQDERWVVTAETRHCLVLTASREGAS